eukprot:6595256-Ditylum_brightwellii.AAC.1
MSSLEGTIGTSQPGGIGLLAQGNIVGQILQTGTDNRGLGWWCYFVLNVQYNKRLWVIAGYRVSQTTNTGTTTAFPQQVQLLKMQGIKKPKPKQQQDIDMLTFLKLIPTEDNIMLLIDANNDLQNSQFSHIVANLGLYDLI